MNDWKIEAKEAYRTEKDAKTKEEIDKFRFLLNTVLGIDADVTDTQVVVDGVYFRLSSDRSVFVSLMCGCGSPGGRYDYVQKKSQLGEVLEYLEEQDEVWCCTCTFKRPPPPPPPIHPLPPSNQESSLSWWKKHLAMVKR